MAGTLKVQICTKWLCNLKKANTLSLFVCIQSFGHLRLGSHDLPPGHSHMLLIHHLAFLSEIQETLSYWNSAILFTYTLVRKNVRSWLKLDGEKWNDHYGISRRHGYPKFPIWQSFNALQALFPEGDIFASGVHSTSVIYYDWLAFWTVRGGLSLSPSTPGVLG